MPELDIRTVDINSDGLENLVLIINDETVFRFARDEKGKKRLAREVTIVQLVRKHVSLTIPEFTEVQEDFVACPKIPGAALHRDLLFTQPDGVQERVAEQLGAFLRELHSIPATELDSAGIDRSPAPAKQEEWVRLFEDVKELLFPHMAQHVRRCVERRFAPVLSGELDMEAFNPVLVHADLGYYHILFDEPSGRINGVLDFGCSGLGDPAGDLSILLHVYGERFLGRLIPHYPSVTQYIDRARFAANTGELRWAAVGVKLDQPSWFMYHLSAARDIMPIGTELKP